MNVQFDIKLSKSQQEIYDLVHDKKYKYYTVVFSRQSGKSVLMQVLCIEWLFGRNNNIAYLCKNFKPLATTLYKNIIKILPKEVIKSSNGSDLSIESIYGSTLTFFSAEQGSSLRGQTFTHVICDEFSFFKMEQTDGTHLWYDILSPTLKARGKKCIFVGTPLGKNNILYDMFQRGMDDDYPQYISIKKTIYDDGFITDDEIERIKKDIPELSFKQEYLCEWLEDGLSFFVGYSDCFDYDDFEEDKTWIGCDLSGDGTDATILTKVNVRDQIQQYEIQGTLDMKYKQISSIIDSSKNLQVAYLEKNGLGSPMINEIKKLVRDKARIREFETTNATKEEIVSEMAVDIANHKVHFQRGDRKLYEELGDFVVTVSKSRKLTFAARGSGHDDRVMSACIAKKAKRDYDSKITKSFANVIRL